MDDVFTHPGKEKVKNMSILSALLLLGCFSVCCAMQSIDYKKLSKRISDLEQKSYPEVSDDKKSN